MFIKTVSLTSKIKGITLLFVVAVILWSLTSTATNMWTFQRNGGLLEEGFTQIVDGQEIPLEHVGDFQAVSEGEPLVLVSTLPSMDSDKTLLFYSKDVVVQVYVDDVSVYRFQMEDGFQFLKTPGDKWNSIQLPAESSGGSLRIELTSNFSNRFESTLSSLYLINNSEILSVILWQDGFRILMSLLLLSMALFVYANAIIWKRRSVRQYFLRLGTVYACTALWLFSMYNAFDFFIQKPVFSYLLSMLMSNFLPVVFFELVKIVYAKKHLLMTWLEYLLWGHFVLQLFLQFVFHISLLDLLPLTYVVYAVGTVAFVGLVVYDFITCRSRIPLALGSLLIIFVGVVAELIVLCILPARTDLIGFSSITGMFLYLIVNHFHILFYESRIDIQKLELEKNYQKLQNTTLMQQIKGHFFFNTLNTISSLCKYDPKEADRAILVFAQYMHSYMNIIDKHEAIPFETELHLVESSLQIEKMRFPDTFTYQIDLEFTDFDVPPLSIQPIVENSMVHGLRQGEKEGAICIKVRKYNDYVQITITDNGTGFDTSRLEDSQSIGLKNLRQRIQWMSNGEMTITSQLGKGTTTTISLPLQPSQGLDRTFCSNP